MAFVQPIVDPVMEAWFRKLASYPDVQLRVFALRRRLSHRPGWETRHDVGFDVEIIRSLKISQGFRVAGSIQRDRGIRLVPLDLLAKLWRFRPDVIFVTNATDLIQALIMKRIRHCKVILFLEDTKLTFSRIGSLVRRLKVLILKRADMYCASSSEARDLALNLGVPFCKIRLTPWAVDNERVASWAASTNVIEVRRKLHLDGLVFIAVSQLIPRKGLDHLLKSWSMVTPERRFKASLLIVGDGIERQRLEQLANDYGLTKVRFVGHIPPKEVAECFAAADVFVLPTLEDAWGFVVSEAMATGLPILCSTHAGSAQDLVREGINGYVFDPLDHARFSALLSDVLDHSESLDEMGRRSKGIIAEFTIDRSISAVVSAIRGSTE